MFKPCNSNNAIRFVEFGIEFGGTIESEVISKLNNAEHDWQTDFPAKTILIDKSPTNVIGEVNSADQKPTGIQFSFLKPNGHAIQFVRIADSTVSLKFNRYSRWSIIRSKMYSVFSQVLDEIKQSDLKIESLSLAVRNVFLWDSDKKDEPEINELLSINPIAPFASINSGVDWLSSYHWIETNDKGNFLNHSRVEFENLPIDENIVDQIEFISIILERTFTYKSGPVSISSIMNENQYGFDNVFEDIHQKNKTTIRSLLSKEMAETIGLSDV